MKESSEDLHAGVALCEKQLFVSKGPLGETSLRLLTYTDSMWEDPRVKGLKTSSLEKLSTGQLKEYFRAKHSHYFNSYFIPLRTPRGKYNFVNCFDGECDWTANITHFVSLQKQIEELPFEILGRVFLIYTPAGAQELVHIDYWPQELGKFYDGKRHFFWISEDKGLKVNNEVLNAKSCMFDFELPHTSLASNQSAISLRVEGQLTKEYCDKKGILWKSRFS